MKSNTEYIIKTLSLPKIGRKTAFKIFNQLSHSISNDTDWVDFILEQAGSFRLPEYTKSDFENAIKKYENIIFKSEKSNIKQVSYYDSAFPKLLKNVPDSPIILNYVGDLSILDSMPTLAIIGTREPSDFGYQSGVRISELFTNFGFNIISGLALGCDTAGHRGCLNAKGKTTAILAHGLDKIYPKENKTLAEEIIDNGGILVSEYFVEQSPLANYFVERDRIQAWLSLGIFVVETDIKGGTMHTVKFAFEANRIVSTLNHPKDKQNHPKVNGNQYLIKEKKAIPVGNSTDVDFLKSKLMERFSPSNIEEKPVVKPIEDEKINPTTSKIKKDNNKPSQPTLWD